MKTSKGLSTEWTSHLQPTEQAEFAATVKASQLALSRLLDIIDSRLRDLDAQESRLTDYDTPSWSHKQAHRNGKRDGLMSVRLLLNFLTKD